MIVHNKGSMFEIYYPTMYSSMVPFNFRHRSFIHIKHHQNFSSHMPVHIWGMNYISGGPRKMKQQSASKGEGLPREDSTVLSVVPRMVRWLIYIFIPKASYMHLYMYRIMHITSSYSTGSLVNILIWILWNLWNHVVDSFMFLRCILPGYHQGENQRGSNQYLPKLADVFNTSSMC